MGKARKAKRMRRSYLKVYSQAFINVGKGPNPEVLAEYNLRAKSLAWSSPWLDRLFPGVHMESTRRLAAKARLEEILNEVPREFVLILQCTKYTKIRLFHNIGMTDCSFVKEETLKGIITRSIHYGSKAAAMQAFELDRITWCKPTRINTILPAET